jgi:hypothetical protein
MVLLLMLPLVGTLLWRQRETLALSRQVEREQETQRQLAQIRPAAAKPAEADLQEGPGEEADREAIARLRAEIEQLKLRAAGKLRTGAPSAKTAAKLEASILQEMLPVEQWKNAGQATPPATLETALWAAAAGDVETLAGLLSIDPVVRTKVNTMLMTLPVSLRQDCGTPERLIALLAARDVPLGAAQIRDYKVSDLSGTKLSAVLRDTENKYRSANLTLRQEGEAWKIIVPATAVERYASMLKGSVAKAEAR